MQQKFTLDIVKNEFISRGHIPLFETYINSNEKLPYNCKCGNPKICQISLQKLKSGRDNCEICISKKTKQTNIDKYGTDHPVKSKIVQDKMKQTNLEKY